MADLSSRPDPFSPAGVAGATFGTARKGFDQHQVREFLRQVAGELTRLHERQAALQQELAEVRAALATAEPATLDEDTVTRMLGEEAARILHTARESGAQIKAKAEEGAGRLLREASEEAARLRSETDVEIARRRHDATADVEAELAMAKQQGREMVEEARTYRERVLGELARRREAARQQIDQLVRSRDRLVQAFERARLTAADVIAEMGPLDAAEEDVDLTATTGPVPVVRLRTPDDSAVSTHALPGEVPRGEPESHVMYDREGESVDEPDPEPVAVESATLDAAPEDAEPSPEDDPSSDEVSSDEVSTDEAAPAAAWPVPEESAEEAPADEATADEPGADEEAPEAGLEDAPAGTSAESADTRGLDIVTAAQPDEPGDETGPDATIVPFPGSSASPTAAPAAVDDLFARLRAESHETGAAAAEDQETPEPEPVAGGEPPSTPPDDEDEGENPFTVREAAIVPLIVAGARKSKRALADEQNDVLDALRRHDAVTSLDLLLADEGTQAKRYTEAIAAELANAAVAGASAVAGAVAPDASVATAAAGDALARELVTPLRERLARCVREGEGDNDAIVKRVRAVYREWKTQRIDEQLDHIVRTAYARAAYEAIEPGRRVTWLVDPDGPQSPDCEDNSLAGALVVGDTFPTGHAYPPAHPGCRCLVVPAAAG